jgi:hypothetical protein
VIRWNDFVFDEVLGFVLDIEGSPNEFRAERTGGSSGEDAATTGPIQETRDEQRPARMVGFSDLDSKPAFDMDVDRSRRPSSSRIAGGRA